MSADVQGFLWWIKLRLRGERCANCRGRLSWSGVCEVDHDRAVCSADCWERYVERWDYAINQEQQPMSDTTPLRDHSQPCEHDSTPGRFKIIGDDRDIWLCGLSCPGGRLMEGTATDWCKTHDEAWGYAGCIVGKRHNGNCVRVCKVIADWPDNQEQQP